MYEIKPGIGVANVVFGQKAESLSSMGYFEDPDGFDEITEWRTYKKNDEFKCYVKNGEVICIACFFDCLIDGFSLMGKELHELVQAMGEPDEIGEPLWVTNDRQQRPYEYFSLGLQIWFEGDKVVSVFCNDEY
ncbi:hypothetical protein [Undibacterium sp. Ji49W]|uniref:hypothetical protein n=1 Tax=Undibacterium sp. Ji49W TaxID=3413040 RepID=UPI003BF01967